MTTTTTTTSSQYIILLTLALCCVQTHVQAARSRYNLFDPLFLDDDVDTHTVTAGSAAQRPSSAGSSVSNFNRLIESRSRLPPAIDELGGATADPQWSTPSARTSAPTISTGRRSIVDSSIGSAKLQATLEPYVTSTATLPPVVLRKETEAPRHWSALENYYKKLSQIELSNALNGAHGQNSNAYYPIGQELEDGSSLAAQLKQYYQKPIYQGAKSANTPASPQLWHYSPASSPPLHIKSKSPHHFDLVPEFSPIKSRPAFLSLQPVEQQQQQQRIEQQVPDSGIVIVLPQQQQQQQPIQQQLPIDSFLAQRNASPAYINWLPTSQTTDLYLSEASRNSEESHLEQLLNRMKHQQDTFGAAMLDPRHKEQSLEESYCGPRNAIRPASRPLHLNREMIASIRNLSETQIAQLFASQIDIPVALSAGEFPSHMGLYNGTTPADDNFLCGATWVHERFALTLASCFKNASTIKTLTVRAGEWNVGRRQANKTVQVTRQVSRMHLFPRYSANSSEHDLALVEWTEPIDFVNQRLAYISPACKMQSRNLLRTSTCWAPVRNVTFREEFDPHGEGETILVRNVSMLEVPVKLYANDELKCAAQSQTQYFHLRHPNYICSDNLRASLWRLKLNKTDHFGSGIYCNENGKLNLVSIVQPIHLNSTSALGYLDLSYYKPWMRNVIWGDLAGLKF